MWRADGYSAVAAFAHRFTLSRTNAAQGMHKDTQEKLLLEVKKRKAITDSRILARSVGHDRFYSIPTHEDVSAIEDEAVWGTADGIGWKALYHFLNKTPLFLVGPGVVEPISNSIVESVFRKSVPVYQPFQGISDFLFFSDERFTVSAKEVFKTAKAAKTLRDKAVAFGFGKRDLKILEWMMTLRSTAEALLPYEGYVLSIRDSDVPKHQDIAVSLLPIGSNGDARADDAKPMGRPRLQEAAAELFRRLYPEGRKKSTWKEVIYRLETEGVSVSETTLKRAIGQKS